MRQQEVFNKIGGILSELNEQYDYLKSQAVPLDDLELELFAANANFLADHLEILRKLNTALAKGNQVQKNLVDPESNGINDIGADNNLIKSPALSEEIPVIKNFEEEQPENKSTDTGFEFDMTTAEPGTLITGQEDNLQNDDIAYVEENTEEAPHHIITENNTENDAPHVDLKPETGGDHFSFIRSDEPDIIRHNLELNEADSFGEDEELPHEETIAEALAEKEHDIENHDHVREGKPLTLNERIAAQSGNKPEQNIGQPIADLKAAINLNDKMLFVRDLFNGYSLAYSEALEILNRFGKLEDAERFLSSNYETKNNWADKPTTREKFYDLLKRRFA